jgi:hypothetical protein
MRPCKNNSHIQVLVTNFFSNPTHKTKIGTASMWDITNSNPVGPIKSNHLPDQKQGPVTKYNLTVFIRLTAPGLALKGVVLFRASASSLPLDFTDEPHPRFLVQGHMLSTIGDALPE